MPSSARVQILVTLATVATVATVQAATYSVAETSVGNSFYTNFDFDAISDPTHGRVNYVNEATARSQNLTFASSDSFVLRTDYKTVLTASGAGRNSVRLKSKKLWNSHVTVIDLRHMPQACGTWPAVWEFAPTPEWPYGGEVDIIEGVNDQGANQAALHTDSGCSMSNLQQTGTLVHADCNSFVDGNTGCTVQFTKANSYGPSFNNAGGGYFAMERTTTAIKIWFWPRSGGGAPSDVVNGASSVNTDNWGTPMANYNNNNCNINAKFAASNIIINLTLCGDWAGQAAIWAQSACASQGDCVSYVNNNPAAFTNAYFDFKALRVYA
ncbi:glycoside hydrolase family 16 protein [Auriculariales sp. MPI-PUGE-AT-0066]|nr:glycoside hydrolase family 16 protein [Auriculariales sp. MPI-PUGE-AT-0066]